MLSSVSKTVTWSIILALFSVDVSHTIFFSVDVSFKTLVLTTVVGGESAAGCKLG